MATIKSLWASVQGDPVFMRRLNGWLTMFWVAMIPVSLATGWVKSVTYVSALSLWPGIVKALALSSSVVVVGRFEALEQLRALWHGFRIVVEVTAGTPAPGVDTQEDLERVRALFASGAV